MARTYGDGYGDVDDFDVAMMKGELAELTVENEQLRQQIAERGAGQRQAEALGAAADLAELDAIEDRDEFYGKLTGGYHATTGLPVDAGGNVDKSRPLFDHGGNPINDAARQVLRERDPRYAELEREADSRDYSPGVKVI